MEELEQTVLHIAKHTKAMRQDVKDINHKMTHFLQNYREDYLGYQRHINEYRN